jgi:RNA polymerase sigma-70 factor (ECF subfamily)
MGEAELADRGAALLALYDRALPQVYGYVLPRCGDARLAEDLTAETFLAAVDAIQRKRPDELSVGWLVTVARNKLVDHWRRKEREERKLTLVQGEPDTEGDEWDERVDAALARDVLASLGAHHQSALTLRYMDDLTVPDVAHALGRTLHATEALLVRARAAFRKAYEARTGDDDA